MRSRPTHQPPNPLVVASQTRLDGSQQDLGRRSCRVVFTKKILLVHLTPCRDSCRAVIHAVLIDPMAGDDDCLTLWRRLVELGAFVQSV